MAAAASYSCFYKPSTNHFEFWQVAKGRLTVNFFNIMRYIFTLLVATLCCSLFSWAQPAGNRMGGMGGMGMGAMQSGRFYGKVVDANSGKPIDAVSVQLITSKFDQASKKRKDTIINGMLTQPNGDFSLESVPFMGDYTLVLTAIGFKESKQKVSFLSPELQKKLMEAFASAAMAPKPAAGDSAKPAAGAPNIMEIIRKAVGNDMSKLMSLADKDLGNFKLEPDATQLENVTVTGKSMVLAVDRKIFNVDKTLAASGATATEIMRQIPSVNVDIDGNVSVRNASPTIFVDGRPTTLTLDQIPSDAIQSVELITNPSAKYDASGGVASILNIVMKKNRKSGYNGSVRMGIDSRARPNFGGDINIRQGKVNGFLSGMLGTRKSISETDIQTRYAASGNQPATGIGQMVDNTNKGLFAFLRGGADFFIDNRNTLTLSGSFVRGRFKNEEMNNMRYDSFFTPVITERGERLTNGEGNFRNMGGTVSFKHIYAKPGHEWTADVNYNQSNFDNEMNFSNQRFNAGNQPMGNALRQITAGSNTNSLVVAQTDYANPLNDNLKLEAGLRLQARDVNSANNNSFYDYNSKQFVLVPSISSNYKFTDQVYAAYTTLTGKAGKLGYNVGLRLESSSYQGNVVGQRDGFSVKYPISAFPSAFLSYKIGDRSDVQLNYTRRINRPNFFQLLPFIDYTDPLNLRLGNAALTPEFTNSLEANYSLQFNNMHTLLLSAYYKNTNQLITNFQYKGLNPATLDSAIFNTFINANSSNRYGFEVTSRNAFTKKFDVTTNLNLYNASINSSNIQTGLSQSQLSFFGKITLTQKLGKTNQWTAQVNADYQSKTVVPVGTGGGGGGRGPMGGGIQAAGSNGFVKPNYGADVSVKYDFWKYSGGQAGYRASLTLSMNDVFRTRIYSIYTSSDFFVQDLSRRRDPQILRLQFNWRFGKIDASLFKRKNMKGEMEGASEGMNGIQ